MASGHSDDTSPADTPAASAKDGQQPPAEAGAAAKLSQELQPPVVTTGAAAESPPPAGAGAANIAAPRQEPQTRKQPSVMLPAETQDDSGPEAPAERAKSQSRRSASPDFESRSKSRRLRASSSRRQPRDSRRHSDSRGDQRGSLPRRDDRQGSRLRSRSKSEWRWRDNSRDNPRGSPRHSSSSQWPPLRQPPSPPPPRRDHEWNMQRRGVQCDICGTVIKGTGHPNGDAAALKAHRKTSSKCLAKTGHGPLKQRCPWGCGKLIASYDAWAEEQHSWHCTGVGARAGRCTAARGAV